MRRLLSTLLVLAAGTIIPAASTLALPAQAAVPAAGSNVAPGRTPTT